MTTEEQNKLYRENLLKISTALYRSLILIPGIRYKITLKISVKERDSVKRNCKIHHQRSKSLIVNRNTV